MPTASIDFTMATLAIIMVIAGALYGVNMVAAPYLETSKSESRYYQIGRNILLSEGNPVDWGREGTPISFGLADGSEAYSLDINKVSRLNPENEYAVKYSTLWRTLGVYDVSLRMEISQIYNLSLSLELLIDNGENTTYTFHAVCTRDGFPIESNMSYYVTVRSSTYMATGTTGSNGIGTVQFTIPDSLSGTALLIGFSKIQDSMVTYHVLPFAHGSIAPQPENTYATLSPLNHLLYYSITNGSAINAAIYTFSYTFNLSANNSEYLIPTLKDRSPMILSLTGITGAEYWAEYVAYPQIQFEVGATMNSDYIISDVSTYTYIINVEGTYYKLKIQFRSPEEYD